MNLPRPSKPLSAQPACHRAGEEWLNGLTHAIGCLFGVLGSVFLLQQLLPGGFSWVLLSCVVYCVALVGVYAASTLSHWVHEPVWRRRMRSWDQGMIFLLIVATFTPFAVVYLSGWWHLLTIVLWCLGSAGFVSKVIHVHCVDRIVLWLYIALGWLPVLALPALWTVVPGLVVLLLAGGIVYTLGSLLLMNDGRQPYFHAGWHVFVMAGSTVHFVAMCIYVLPKVGVA